MSSTQAIDFDMDRLVGVLSHKSNEVQNRDFFSESANTVKISAEECKSLCVAAGVEYKPGYENRILAYTCSDESVDRYGDVVRQAGWDLENFRKNPVIMLNHDYSRLPVASGIKVWIDPEAKKLKMWILFPDADISEDSDRAFRLAKAGFMKASSVGFIPKQTGNLTIKEKEAIGMPPWGVEFLSQELLEHTLCGVPANPNAIQEAITKNIVSRTELKSWVKNIPEEPIKTYTETEVAEKIEKAISDFSSTVEEKAGAVLSKKNKKIIEDAISALKTASDTLTNLLEATNTDDSNMPENDDDLITSLNVDDDESDSNDFDMYAVELVKENLSQILKSF